MAAKSTNVVRGDWGAFYASIDNTGVRFELHDGWIRSSVQCRVTDDRGAGTTGRQYRFPRLLGELQHPDQQDSVFLASRFGGGCGGDYRRNQLIDGDRPNAGCGILNFLSGGTRVG